nr:ABC transporter B family member 29, chloroplastic isoform X1 [Tanacetum cinerariifolium]
MAKQQTIKYAPQYSVIFQTNNVVGNFNYPPNVPAYKPIMKFLRNCPLYNASTNCPSVVYQNFLREFWSTAVAFDPFPSTDEPEKRPLKEFLIKFSVSNGQRPLTLDFKTFCSSTGLDYNNGKYVDHPTPEVLGGNYSIEQVNSIQQLLAYSVTGTEEKKFGFLLPILSNSNFTKDPSKVIEIELTAHMIDVNNRRDSVSPPPLAAKPKKGKSHTVTSTSPKSQGPEASGALSKKSKRPTSKKPPTETKRDIQLSSTGLPSTLDEGTRKSKHLPEGTITHPKDLGGNVQPLDRDLTFTTSDEGTAKTTPRHEGSRGDKDSRGNKPSADMEPQNPTDADLSRIGAKYHEDQTQSSRLRYESLTGNEGEPSYEGEPNTQPMLLTYADLRAILLSEDEAQESEEDILGVAPSSSVTLTFALTDTPANVEGENTTHTATKEPPSHTDGKTHANIQEKPEKPKQSTDANIEFIGSSTHPPSITQAQPITIIHPEPSVPQREGKVYRGTDGRNFDVHKPFLFGAFALPAPEQASCQASGRKRKHMKLETETRISGLECNRALLENVPFVNNMVIEDSEYRIFFTNEFGDQAFQRWSDIDKVGIEALVSYLVVASMVKSPENTRFSMKLRKLVAEHPDQEKLKSKKVKIAIARALYQNPSILVLDEATSALDTRSEMLVRQALQRLTKNRTVIVIAHRLETVLMAERVFLLSEGKLQEISRSSLLVAQHDSLASSGLVI